jgi:hypothetical protein
MTATTTRAEINRRNASRSTGPRSPEGKSRAKLNAVKHGMTAKTPVLPGEDPDAYRGRLDAWVEALEPVNVVEQFLVEQAATASWKIERADRVEAARVAAALRDAEADERAGRREEADRLGRLLLGLDGRAADPALAREVLRTLDPGHSGPAADPLAPLRPIVDRLESTAEGCGWLLERWAELRDPLERGTDWDKDRFVQAVRLSGRQPMDLTPEAWDFHGQLPYFGGVEELEPSGDPALDAERQEARDAAIRERAEAEDCRELARQLVEVWPEDQAEARSALLGFVERASGRLTELAAAHEARWEAEAVERAERMILDPSPEDARLWRHQFGCGRSMRRMLDTLLKLRREDRAAGRADGRGEGRNAAPPDAQNEATDQAVAPPPCSPDEATAPVAETSPPQDEATVPVVDQTPVPDETAAPAVDQTPVPDEAAAALVAPSSLQDEATDQAVERTPVIDDATAPPLADRSFPQNEATAPARSSAREVSMVLVTALALLSSAGFGAAFGRSTDVIPRPSPISAHEPRGPRTTHPGGDHQGPGESPPEGGTPTGPEYRPCWSPPSGGRWGKIRPGSAPS